MRTIHLSFTPTLEPLGADAAPDAIRKFRGVAYSGGLVPDFGDFGDTVIDLTGIRFAERLPALINHDDNRYAGKATLQQDGHQLLASGELSNATADGKLIAALLDEQAPWQMSVGLQGKVQTGKPRTITANGRTFTARTLFHDATIRELSFVPVGADPNTSLSKFNRQDQSMTDETIAELRRQLDSALQATQAAETSRQAADARVTELQGQLDTIKAELSALRKTTRTQQLNEALGEVTEDEAKPYLEMTDVQFSAVMAHMGKGKGIPGSLTTTQAKSGKDPDDDKDAAVMPFSADVFEMRRKAVKGS